MARRTLKTDLMRCSRTSVGTVVTTGPKCILTAITKAPFETDGYETDDPRRKNESESESEEDESDEEVDDEEDEMMRWVGINLSWSLRFV